MNQEAYNQQTTDHHEDLYQKDGIKDQVRVNTIFRKVAIWIVTILIVPPIWGMFIMQITDKF